MTHSTVSRPAPPGAPPGAAALMRGWHRAERWLAFASFSLVAALAIYDVVARELLAPILAPFGLKPTALVVTGSAKMAVYTLIVGAFCGIGIATASGVQLVPKVGFKWVPASWNAAMDRLADAVTGVALIGVTCFAVQFVESSRATGMLTSGGVEVPAWIIQAAIPLGFASAAVRYVFYAIWPALRPVPPEFQE